MAWEAGRGGSRGELAVPAGDPAALRGAAARFRRVANRGLATSSVSGSAAPELSLHWQGAAAVTAGAELSQLSARAQRLLPGLDAAGLALTTYADAIEYTQGRVRALRANAARARDEHARSLAASRGGGTDPVIAVQLGERADRELDQTMRLIHRAYGACVDDFTESGARCARTLALISRAAGGGRGGTAVRADVLAGLQLAQQQIQAASTPPVGQVVAAAEPDTWWESALESAGDAAAWTYSHTAVPVVNGAANLLEAAAEHPEDLLEMAIGAGMIVVGAGGEVAGLALDATGVGAVAGVPINVAAAGLVAAGAGAVAHGGSRLADHAAQKDNRLLQEVDGPSVAGNRANAGDPLPDSTRPSVAGGDWKGRVAETGKGDVWQRPENIDVAPGLPQKANSLRIMHPDADPRYPNGYVVFHNEHGQPLTLDGLPGRRRGAETHIAIRPDESFDVPKGWAP